MVMRDNGLEDVSDYRPALKPAKSCRTVPERGHFEGFLVPSGIKMAKKV